jgi:hypothetical protein
MSTMDTQQRIKQQVDSHPVVLFMKGTPPDAAVRLLGACRAGAQRVRRRRVPLGERARRPRDPPGHQGIRQLADDPAALRQRRVRWRLRHHALREMYQSGELQKLLAELQKA